MLFIVHLQTSVGLAVRPRELTPESKSLAHIGKQKNLLENACKITTTIDSASLGNPHSPRIATRHQAIRCNRLYLAGGLDMGMGLAGFKVIYRSTWVIRTEPVQDERTVPKT